MAMRLYGGVRSVLWWGVSWGKMRQGLGRVEMVPGSWEKLELSMVRSLSFDMRVCVTSRGHRGRHESSFSGDRNWWCRGLKI